MQGDSSRRRDVLTMPKGSQNPRGPVAPSSDSTPICGAAARTTGTGATGAGAKPKACVATLASILISGVNLPEQQ